MVKYLLKPLIVTEAPLVKLTELCSVNPHIAFGSNASIATNIYLITLLKILDLNISFNVF